LQYKNSLTTESSPRMRRLTYGRNSGVSTRSRLIQARTKPSSTALCISETFSPRNYLNRNRTERMTGQTKVKYRWGKKEDGDEAVNAER